ncbi:MAG TPA: hypothetical protein DCP69_01475 [Candidatus Omnitrophica bacterium]|nr:hypothetical protein [Candidatus Omnitrophota bacterium]
MMDNLIVFVPFILGLTLFSVLYVAERLSARRYQRRIERRLSSLRYSLTYPRIPRPYQHKAR